jgi:hypothetical protein
MTGSETQNFDLAIQFSEQAFNELLFLVFQAPVQTVCSAIPGHSAADCNILAVNVLFDRPTDFTPRPPAGQDVIDVRITVGPSGNIGTLRIVVGLDIVHSATTDDLILNFTSKTYFVQGTGLIGLLPNLRTRVEGFGAPALLKPEVTRGSTDPKVLTSFDVRIVDDTSGADLDAAAFLLNFGGGGPGNRNGFSRSFVPPGGRGAIAIFFDWLCRILDQALNDQFGDPTLFDHCTLQHSIEVDASEHVSLTQFSMTLEDGFVQIRAAVEKSGFCYTARGTMGARLLFNITDGQLNASVTLDAPRVDIDIPWYCWLAAVVVGFVIGALAGVLGSIIGAILVPMLLSMTRDTVENVINRVLSDLTDRINNLVPEVHVPLSLVSIVFQRVFLDDITVVCDVAVDDRAPVKASGVLTIPNGAFADLDTGQIGGEDLSGADLGWVGSDYGRHLRTVCEAGLARTGSTNFGSFSRHALWRYVYESPANVPLFELAMVDPFGIFTGDFFNETRLVYGVHTDDDRYAVVRVIEVTQEYIRLEFKTYDKFVPSVHIEGGWHCVLPDKATPVGPIVFEPSKVPMASLPTTKGSTTSTPTKDPCAGMRKEVLPLIDRAAAEASVIAQLPADQLILGTWSTDFLADASERGEFEAAVDGLEGDLTYAWEVAGNALSGESGRITVQGSRMNYTVHGRRLDLGWSRETPAEIGIKVTVRDAGGTQVSTKRCVSFEPHCPKRVRVTPKWTVVKADYMTHWGIVEVAPTTATKGPTITVATTGGSTSSGGGRTKSKRSTLLRSRK